MLVLLLSVLSGSALAAPLNVGYVPALSVSQLYVMEGEGWSKQAGIEIKRTRFEDGPGIIEALKKGTVDVAYFGIGPAILASSKGVDIKVIASNIVEHISFVTRGDLTLYMLRDPKAGIERFAAQKKRKPKIATLPKGSVPDTVLRYWLLKVAKLPESSLDIVPMGIDRVERALLDGSVDGAAILDPITTLVLMRDKTAKIVLEGGDMMANQPGAILAVRSEILRKKPDLVHKLLELHNRATDFLIREPNRAAVDVQKVIGEGPVTLAVIERALHAPHVKFVADPYRIIKSTQLMHDFQLEIGELSKAVSLKNLFDFKFFNKLMGWRDSTPFAELEAPS